MAIKWSNLFEKTTGCPVDVITSDGKSLHLAVLPASSASILYGKSDLVFVSLGISLDCTSAMMESHVFLQTEKFAVFVFTVTGSRIKNVTHALKHLWLAGSKWPVSSVHWVQFEARPLPMTKPKAECDDQMGRWCQIIITLNVFYLSIREESLPDVHQPSRDPSHRPAQERVHAGGSHSEERRGSRRGRVDQQDVLVWPVPSQDLQVLKRSTALTSGGSGNAIETLCSLAFPSFFFFSPHPVHQSWTVSTRHSLWKQDTHTWRLWVCESVCVCYTCSAVSSVW